MVDTMALLPPFIRASRIPPYHLTGGLPADDEVLLDVPDDRLGPALVAAGQGGYGRAAELLAATRESAAWELRDRYVRRLSGFARSRPDWYDAWRAEAPYDPDQLLLGAQLAVDRVWDSPARAELLRDVSPLITVAARGEDRDPVPWRIALDHARGSQAGHTYFGELWEAALRRAPLHYGCHVAALRYLATSWRGSYRECFDFADRAAQDGPPGSLIQALPARAALACLTEGGGTAVPREGLGAAADRAIELSATFAAADLWPAEVRNKLVYVLVRLGRWTDALDQLRMIGPYATSFPWGRESEDPLGRFLEVREEVRRHALIHPRSEHGGRVRSGGH
jgi:hypothetical protein